MTIFFLRLPSSVFRLLALILFLYAIAGYGQRIFAPTSKWQLRGTFLSDSVKIGKPIRYALTLRHSSRIEVVFPDSAYPFSPFEYVGKQFFPTHTDLKGLSVDSVVYTLTTFSIDSVQPLSVPVYVVGKGDCTRIYTEADTVILHQLIRQSPGQLPLKVNTAYVRVPQQTNYLFVAVLGGAIMFFGLLVYSLFGKRIGKRYKLFRMGRHHRGFMGAYEKLIRRGRQQADVATVENAVVLWKEYMEWLEEKPFSTYTTKEITELIPDSTLAEALQDTDRVIYAKMPSETSFRSMRTLEYIAARRYREKKALLESLKAWEVV